MTLTSDLDITSITWSFYSDRNCSNLISQTAINGYTTLLAGSYTTTTGANLELCSRFSYLGTSGCIYEYTSTSSIGISITSQSGSGTPQLCVTNPKSSSERLAHYFSSVWSQNCSQGGASCSFSQGYILPVISQ